jgi:hypothetical protein
MCVCTHADCNTTDIICAPHEPLLVADGSTNSGSAGSDGGGDISIPTILIYKTSADQLRNLIQDKNQPLLMELVFGRGNEEKPALPPPAENNGTDTGGTCQVNPIAEYSLWTTPIDPISVQLFASFPKVIAELQKQIHDEDYDLVASLIEFSSNHPYLIQGNDANTIDNENKQNEGGYWHCPTNAACEHVCTNNGRYCTTPTRASTLHGISTLDVVTESLRRACIWKVYHNDNENAAADTVEQKIARATGQTWWSYVAAFTESCFTVDQAKGLDVPSKSADDNTTTPSRFADAECIHQAYTAANVDAHLIDACMTESGTIYVHDNNTDTSNSLLDEQATFQRRHGIHYHPAAFVNDLPLAVQPHEAVVSTRTLFRALCSALEHRRPTGGTSNAPLALPPLCHNCEWCHDIVGCMQHGGSCDAAWKQQRVDEKQRRDDERKKHEHDHDKTPPSGGRSEGMVHHFFRVLFIMAVLGMFGYGGWHYYQTRYSGGGGRNPFRRGGGDGSLLGNYVPLSSGGGDVGGLFGSSGGGDGSDMGEGGTVQFLSG